MTTPEQYIIAGEDTGEQWEWQVTDVWYKPSVDRFFIYSGGGCSCNYAYEEEGEDDPANMEGPYTFHEVLRHVGSNLKGRVLTWDRKGRPASEDVDRW